MLVAARVLADAVDVHPALVGEGARADERLAGAEVHVGGLIYVARDLGETGERLAGEDLVIGIFEGEVRHRATEVDVAATLADAVDRALNLGRAAADGGQGVGDGEVAVVVGVDADRDGDGFAHRLDGRGDLVGQGAAVRVAEHDPGGTRGGGGLDALEGVVGVALETVEEVLGVVDDLGRVGGEEGDRVGDHS